MKAQTYKTTDGREIEIEVADTKIIARFSSTKLGVIEGEMGN